jgi:hypothetical protein
MPVVHRLFRRRTVRAAVLALALVSLSGAPAAADDYDSYRTGHPLRILAYLLHPVGVAIDYLIMRPAHWIGSEEPMDTIVGHEQTEHEKLVRAAEHAEHAEHGDPAERAEHADEVVPYQVPSRDQGREVPPSTGFNRRR